MARAKVFFKLNQGAAISAIGPMVDQAAYRASQQMRGRVLANIYRLGRVNTAAMVRGMQARRTNPGSPLMARYEVSSTARSERDGFNYPAAQELGTRAHGPVVASHLVFQIRGRGPVIFAKWVRGVTPGRFMRDALAATRPSDAAR